MRRRKDKAITDILADEETITNIDNKVNSALSNSPPAAPEKQNSEETHAAPNLSKEPSSYSIIKETQAEQDEEDMAMTRIDLEMKLDMEQNKV